MDKCMKGRDANDKITKENNRQITGMGCSAMMGPCIRRQISSCQEEAAPHRLVSSSIAWCRLFVMAHALSSVPVPTLMRRLLVVWLLMLGLPLVGGDQHPVKRREIAEVERLCCPRPLGGTRGHPCSDVGRTPGSALGQGTQQVAGEKREFEWTVLGMRRRWLKRRMIAVRE
jgi:hypothetical protein